MTARFKDSKTRLRVAGIGVVSSSNLTDEMAKRLINLNGAYAKYITFDNGKTGKSGGSKSVKGSGSKGGDSKGGESSKGGEESKESQGS